MVRKQMVSSLTELVKTYPDNDCCIDNWVEGVFPLILGRRTESLGKSSRGKDVHAYFFALRSSFIVVAERLGTTVWQLGWTLSK